jgi:two-component system chemotaxis sensor kinase CheA
MEVTLMADLYDLKAIFLEELDEQLNLMEEEILNLEQGGAQAHSLQSLFRAAHTIKGSSAAMGYVELKNLTHELEHLLDRLRRDDLKLSSPLTNLFFECLDFLKLLQQRILANAELPDSTPIIVRLKAFDAPAKPVSRQTEAVAGGWPEEALAAISRYDTASGQLYGITVKLSEECFMPEARTAVISAKLQGLSEILWKSAEQTVENASARALPVVWLIASECDAQELHQMIAGLIDVHEVAVQLVAKPEEMNTAEQDDAERLVHKEMTEHADKYQQGGSKVKSQTIRVNVERLENVLNLLGELVIDQTRLGQAVSVLKREKGPKESSDALVEISDHITKLVSELQENVMKVRMLPLEQLFNRFPRMVRDLAQTLNKEVELVMEGGDTELDRNLIEEIGDPLIHLIRNAIDHGIELPGIREAGGKERRGKLLIRATHEDNQVVIKVKDDGGGIDAARIRQSAIDKGVIGQEEAKMLDEQKLLHLIFHPGFSTAAKVSEVSGRGVGMDIVRTEIERLNGIIDIETAIGEGTTFTIRLPLTMAITSGLLVKVSDQVLIVPMNSVVEIMRIGEEQIRQIRGKPVITIRQQVIPMIWLHELLGYERVRQSYVKVPVVVIGRAEKRLALCVDELLGNQEIVIKSLGQYIGKIEGITGATILGNGGIALILETGGMMRKAGSM